MDTSQVMYTSNMYTDYVHGNNTNRKSNAFFNLTNHTPT